MAQPAPQYGYVVALLPFTEAAATLDRLGEDGFLPAQITPLRGHDLLGTLAQRPASAAHPVPDTEVGHGPIMVVVLPVAEPEQRRRAEDLLTADGAAFSVSCGSSPHSCGSFSRAMRIHGRPCVGTPQRPGSTHRFVGARGG